ncbi:MAG: DUF6443 domain-containing protein [Saprospiraceae bacterium]
MNTKRSFIILIVVLKIVSGFSQPKNNLIKDVAMPAPNAASLGKFGDIPISPFTGIPNISVPIFTLEEGPLSLPIAIIYHASGVKVGEPASWVGLGWALSAGGMITRTTLGKPDDAPGGYIDFANSLLSPLSGSSASTIQADDISSGKFDSEPDIFNVSLPGLNFKFSRENTGNFFIFPVQDIKISFIRENNPSGVNPIYQWKIIGPDGTKYTFGRLTSNITATDGLEYTTYDNMNNSDKMPTSWYLSKIETPDDLHKIELDYVNEKYSYKTLSTCNINWAYSLYGVDVQNCNGIAEGPNMYINNNYMEGKRLAAIRTSTYRADFIASTSRQDLDTYLGGSAFRLDAIEIKQNNSPNTCYKRFGFNYSYFQSPNDPGKSYYKRLKLNSIQESTCDQTTITIPPYTFDYVTGDLPHRLSKAIDHWGYYNGATNNEGTLNIPASSIVLPIGTAYSPPAANANREVGAGFIQNGTLRKITYPTGGNTSFTYETHEQSNIQNTPTTNFEFTLTNCTVPGGTCCSATPTVSNVTTFTSSQITSSTEFTVTGTNLLFPPPNITKCDGSIAGFVYVQISARHATNNSSAGNYQFEIHDASFVSHERILSNFFNLVPGQSYIFTLTVYNAKATFQIINYTSTVNTVTTPVGGLRIKQIRINDGNPSSNIDIIKNYTYKESDNSYSSSAVVYNPATYAAVHKDYVNGGILGVTWFATSVVPMGNFLGYSIGYRRVKEEIVGSGFTEYLYNAVPDINNSDNTLPIRPILFNPKDGYEIRKSYLSNSNQEISYTNNYPLGETYTSMTGLIFKIDKFNFKVDLNGSLQTAYSAKSYQPITAPFRLSAVINNQDGVTTTSNYTYDASDRFLAPVTMSVTNSDGKVHKTKYKYPADFVGTAVYDTMRARNMIIPIQTVKEVNNTDVDGSRTEYSLFSPTTGNPIGIGGNPYSYQFMRYKYTWNAAGAGIATGWQVDGTVNQIDIATGFPKQFTMDNWSTESYTWNPTNKLIASKSFQGFTWNYSYYPNSRLLSSITDIDGQVQSFTYDALMRLSLTSTRGGAAKRLYSYVYKNASNANNYVETSNQYTPLTNSALSHKTIRAYVDGLGRPIQTIGIGQSPAGKDVVSLTEYDAQGRVLKEYVPYEGGDGSGSFRSSAPNPIPTYNLTTYEPSPLNRIASKTPPSWDATQFSYGANDGADNVLNSIGTSFSAGSLMKLSVTDPDGNKNISFSDILGRKILSRRIGLNSGEKADTYTYYDDKSRPTTIIPPGASTTTSDLIFKYLYDAEDKLISKDVPDAAAIFSVYNNKDLPVLVSVPHVINTWVGTEYDAYGRPTKTGLITSASPPSPDAAFSYTTVLSQMAYDGAYLDGTAVNNATINKGKQTGYKYNVLGTTNNIIGKNTYDTYGRLSNLTSNNLLNLTSYTAENITYGFDNADNLLTESRAHSNSIFTGTNSNRTTYDHWGRKSIFYNTFPGGSERQLATYGYNYRDFLTTLQLGTFGSSPLQTVDYTYNEQGWLTGINQPQVGGTVPSLTMPYTVNSIGNDALDLFSLKLTYNDPVADNDIPSIARKNGNISQAWYKVRGRNTEAYGYTYDYLDRLTAARHIATDPSGARTINGYNEEIGYADARGNISSIYRTGMAYTSATAVTQGVIDQLSFSYLANTNKLVTVTDGATDITLKAKGFNPGSGGAGYGYDASGNLISDSYKGISSIIYNHLNLPSSVSFSSGAKIIFTYAANGKKLRKQVYATNGTTINTTIDYVDGIEYLNGKVEAIYNPEGRAYNTSTTATPSWRYEYNIKDHLGNNRISFSDINGNGSISNAEVLQEQHYYPFGMAQEGPWMNNSSGDDSRYTYNGKEWNNDFGIGLLDYGFRNMDPYIGRFTSLDPKGYKYSSWSPYNYVLNNPINIIDPKGDTIKVMVVDQDQRPKDNGTEGESYTANIYLFDTENGDLNGPYSGSSYPNSNSNSDNSTSYNTINEGEHIYNNLSGHKSGTKKGLNLVNNQNQRQNPGTNSTGGEVTMSYVNVHAGVSNKGNYNSRGSGGCITICPGNGPDQADKFFANFNWINNGNTGNSGGKIKIIRMESDKKEREEIRLQERSYTIKEEYYNPIN